MTKKLRKKLSTSMTFDYDLMYEFLGFNNDYSQPFVSLIMKKYNSEDTFKGLP